MSHLPRHSLAFLTSAFATALCALAAPVSAEFRVIKGDITDSQTHQPIAYVTVRLVGSGSTTLSNDKGEYRLLVSTDSCALKFSHVAYYSDLQTMVLTDTVVELNITLRPNLIELPPQEVYSRDYNAAQRIILKAIKRKKEILAKLQNYSFDGYTKLVVRDLKKPDSSNIMLLTETQTSSFWERPSRYKEIIRARRESSNLNADRNLVTVGEIRNFAKDRIQIGRYEVVSPIGAEALNSYNYYLLDSADMDGRRVFELEVEPKSEGIPLFAGKIRIIDSTFDVVAVDLGFNKGFHLRFVQNPRYTQQFAEFQNEYWMPVEIRFTGTIKFAVPIPNVPSELSFAHVASLYSFAFDTPLPKGTFDEYAVQVDPNADHPDSLQWNTHQTIPLTTEETQAYRRIDSIQRAPKPFTRRVYNAFRDLPLIAASTRDFFHFNRVEGAYVGVGGKLTRVVPRADFRFKTGYAIDGHFWENEYGVTYHLWTRYRFQVGLLYSDEIVPRQAAVSAWGDHSTIAALLFRSDPQDYYQQRGFTLQSSGRFLPHTTISAGFNDYRQLSVPVATSFSLLHRSPRDTLRDNPPIDEGNLRSVTASISYDSRKLIDSKGKDLIYGQRSFWQITTGVEYASPGFIPNDFDFRKYFAQFYVRHSLLGLGLSGISVYAGSSDGNLPPERYYTVNFGSDIFDLSEGFRTQRRLNFAGSQILVLNWTHNFDHLLFAKCGLPLIKKIPYTLQIRGGAFWTDFRDHHYEVGDENIAVARTAYSEFGFSLGNLTPFLSPFNLSVGFTWQLSHYDTSKFSSLIGFRL